MGNKMKNLSLVVMAAGMGSRYGGLKQLDSFGPNGETIIDYCVYDAIESGFKKVVFIIREEFSDEFMEKISNKFKNQIKVEHVFQSLYDIPSKYVFPKQREKPWGTGHAILSSFKALDGPFIVINGDDFYGKQSFKIAAEFYQDSRNDFSMVSFKLKNTLSDFGGVSRGVCSSSNQKLLSVKEIHGLHAKDGLIRSENKEFTGKELVSMNMWGFSTHIFKYLHEKFEIFLDEFGDEERSEFLIPEVINELIVNQDEEVHILTSDASWFGVTYKEDQKSVVKKINDLIINGEYPNKLF